MSEFDSSKVILKCMFEQGKTEGLYRGRYSGVFHMSLEMLKSGYSYNEIFEFSIPSYNKIRELNKETLL